MFLKNLYIEVYKMIIGTLMKEVSIYRMRSNNTLMKEASYKFDMR